MTIIFWISAISVDYDLYFSDPLRSSAAQVVPFDTGSADSLTIALWVQFTQQDEGGIFFTAYSVRYRPKDVNLCIDQPCLSSF